MQIASFCSYLDKDKGSLHKEEEDKKKDREKEQDREQDRRQDKGKEQL